MEEKKICDEPKKRKVIQYPHCKECGELVTPLSIRDYVYKMNYNGKMIYFCNWNCMRKWQRERGLTAEQLSEKAMQKDRDYYAGLGSSANKKKRRVKSDTVNK